jgi:hypothetical protein
MATNLPSDKSLWQYHRDSPDVLIKDFRGWLFSFPTSYYNNGSGGSGKSASDRYTYANGRYFGSGISSNAGNLNGEPWSLTKKVNDGNYNDNQGSSISPYRSDNANSYGNITTLNNHPTPPGYEKRSSGSGDNDGRGTSGYLIANVDNFDNFHFAVYTKKNIRAFYTELLNSANANKSQLRKMGGADCAWSGENRWNSDATRNGSVDYCDLICDGAADTKDACNTGTNKWCLADSSGRIGKYENKLVTPTSNAVCIQAIKEGRFDDNINTWCKTSDINSEFCKDIRKNVGTDNAKTQLNAYLYQTACSKDNSIGTNVCDDVRATCNDTNQLLADIAPYNCRTLVKNLNEDSNIITMTSKMDLSKVPAARRIEMLEYFNKPLTNAVEDSLCSIAGNASDAACQTYLNNNFSNLVKTTQTKPILIMYFTGGTQFNTKAGMDAVDNSKMVFKTDNNTKVGFNSTPITLSAPWTAKLYTYLTPSTTTDYLFRVNVDDAAKVYLNNNLIINAWDNAPCCVNYFSPYITLDSTKGPYLLYIEYADTGGYASITLEYTTKAIINNRTPSDSGVNYYALATLPDNGPLSGISPLPAPLIANSLYMSPFNPYTLVSNSRKIQSITYCSKDNRFAKDDNCRGTSANGYKAINSTYVTSDNTFKKYMTDYCAKDNNFSTDVFCIGDATLEDDYSNGINKNANVYDSANTSMHTAIDAFCKLEKNNTYKEGESTASKWCKTTDNINNTNIDKPLLQALHPEYAKTLRNTRLKYIQDAIATSIKTGGALTQDVIDYITADYKTLQSKGGINLYPDSNIITPDLTSYCENADSGLKTNLCNNIYTSYKTNPTISSSQARIDDIVNCITNNAFMGKSNSPDFNKSCMLKRDAPATYARYLPLAIQYCGTGDNIVSPECTSYYNNIQGNINNAMNANYTNANSTSKSSFSNKESFRGGSCDDYDDNECGNCNESSDYSYLFILFICFVLVLCCCSSYSRSYSKCQKNKHHQEQIPFATVVTAQR